VNPWGHKELITLRLLNKVEEIENWEHRTHNYCF